MLFRSVANNPLRYIDPTGMDISFYLWKYSEDLGFTYKAVSYNELNANMQAVVEAFAKTDEGYGILKDFANKGDKIGSVEFSEKGKYAKHEIVIGDVFYTGGDFANGQIGFNESKDHLVFRTDINSSNSIEQIAITMGHEFFIHMSPYKDRLINAYDRGDKATIGQMRKEWNERGNDRRGGPDHDGYIRGDSKYSKMGTYINQINNVLNPSKVNSIIKAHDEYYRKQLKR